MLDLKRSKSEAVLSRFSLSPYHSAGGWPQSWWNIKPTGEFRACSTDSPLWVYVFQPVSAWRHTIVVRKSLPESDICRVTAFRPAVSTRIDLCPLQTYTTLRSGGMKSFLMLKYWLVVLNMVIMHWRLIKIVLKDVVLFTICTVM